MSRSVKVLSILALMALLCVGLFAADQSITGTVKDSSGGVIPGASITLTHVDTGTARTAVTDDSGHYSFMNIRVGRYELKAELEGFQPAKITDIKVNIGDSLAFPLTLAVTNVSETVEIKADVEQVQTTTSQLDNVIDERRVTDLPLNGRNPLDLVFLTPGVSNGGNGTASANGARGRGNNYQLDGVDNNNTSTMGAVVSTNVDATSEFRVVTSNPSAEYGRAGGAIIDVITKSGSNKYSGNVFWFHRNAALDANEWSNNRNGLDRGVYRRNQIGASFGGPVIKDKLFFFANTEIMRYYKDAGTTIRTPYTSFLNQITNADLKQLLQTYYPAPNTDTVYATGVSGNYAFAAPTKINSEQYTLKLDYTHSAAHSFSARAFYNRGDEDDTGGVALLRKSGLNVYKGHDISIALDWTWILSPTLVNNMKVSQLRRNSNLDREENPYDISFGGGTNDTKAYFTSYGYLGYGDQVTHAGTFQAKDTLTWTLGKHTIKAGADLRWISANKANNFGRIPSAYFGDSSYDSTPTLDAIKMGKLNYINLQVYSDGQNFSAACDDGRGWRQHEYDFFVQDDWKVLNNLTINAGLRYEAKPAPYDINGRYANYDSRTMMDGYHLPNPNNFFDPANFKDGKWMNQYNYFVGRTSVDNANWVGNPGTSVLLKYMYDAPKYNFAPRAGFSWDVFGNGKTAIRGGYGISYDRLFDNLLSWSTSQMPFGTSMAFAATANGRSGLYPNGVATLANGVPLPTVNLKPGAGAYVNFPTIYNNDWKSPYIQTWNFSLQKELWTGNILELGYVGSSGVNLLGRSNPSQMNYPTAAFIADYRKLVGTTENMNSAIAMMNTVNSQFRQINYVDTFAHSTYHAMQASFSHRFQSGLQFQANYTYAKSFDNAAELTSNLAVGTGFFASDYHNLSYDRGFSSFDVRHNFNANFIYELPFGPGKWIGGNSEGFLAQLIGGWQVNAIISANSGYPLDYKVPRDTIGTGLGSGSNAYPRPFVLQADFPRNGNLTGPGLSNFGWTKDYINFGTPSGNYYRGFFRASGFTNVDLSIFKEVKLPWFRAEGAKLQFRAEAFNLFNAVNYGLPNRTFSDTLNFGKSTTSAASREIQFGLKLLF